jgi:short-subunit dehydrogenase
MNADIDSDNSPGGLAVITGASSGIGLALAREFVQHGFDLVIAAEDPLIEEAASALRSSGRQVTAVRADLATADGVEQLWSATLALGRPVAAAAINAGIGVGGRFAETALEDHLRLVDLNVRSTVHLTKLVLDQMVGQGSGRILITSSVAATTPGPYHATYAASKAFGHSFAESIRQELQDTGVTVTSLMPGPTDTNFFERAGLQDSPLGRGSKDDPDEVAADGFQALMDGKPHVVPGSMKNRVMAEVGTHLPDRVASKAMGAQTKPDQTKEAERLEQQADQQADQ